MKVIPAAGRQVPDPYLGDNLPPEGRTVERNQYWLRRIEDGDVTEVVEVTKPVAAASGTGKNKETGNEIH